MQVSLEVRMVSKVAVLMRVAIVKKTTHCVLYECHGSSALVTDMVAYNHDLWKLHTCQSIAILTTGPISFFFCCHVMKTKLTCSNAHTRALSLVLLIDEAG